MAKKKSSSKKSIEKDFEKLYDHIDAQKFENIEELQAFLSQMSGKKMEDIIPQSNRKLSKEEQSSDLVYEAFETSPKKGKKLVEKALKLDPDNAEAYNYLGSIESNLNKAAEHYKKGMAAGRKKIGEKEFKELKGHFWGFHQTRPYMRAKAGYAECLYLTGKIEESINQYSELLELNPQDNQGLRFPYASILVHHNKFSEFEKLRKLFEGEGSTLWLYTYAIYIFKKEGNSPKANKALLEAYKSNQHVIHFLLGEKEMPDTIPEYYGLGDENEAIIYLWEAGKLWIETKGAFAWVNKFYQKRNKIN